MSKSLRRVKAALAELGLEDTICETQGATTAQMAADAVGCEVDQIEISIIFQVAETVQIVLFITAGGQQVNLKKAEAIVGTTLTKADAALIRRTTGFAIGGVSPLGHKTPCPVYLDETPLKFDVIWIAAGTPKHVFSIEPTFIAQKSSAQVSDFIS